jgi:hypothetical protein
MRLNANFGSIIVVLLFLGSMIGMRADHEDEFIREYNAPHYVAPAPAAAMAIADTLPPWPGAVGDGAMALDRCRDSVRAGAWPLKVWRITSGDTTSGSSALEIFRDSLMLPAYNDTVYNIVQVWHDSATFLDNESMNKLAWNCTYLAGQTSRGEGLVFWGGRVGWVGNAISDTVQDVVLRGFTSNLNNMVISGHRVYVDHVTARWQGTDGGLHNFSFGADTSGGNPQSRFTRHITADYIMAYEPRAQHPTNVGWGSSPRDEPSTSQGLLYRSMPCAGGGYRCPNVQWDTATLAHLVNFNWRDRAVGGANQAIFNIISSFWLFGGETATGGHRGYPLWSGNSCDGQFANALSATSDSNCVRQIYTARWWFLRDKSAPDTLLFDDPRNDDPANRFWKTTAHGDSVAVCRFNYATSAGKVNGDTDPGAQCTSGNDGDTIPTHHRSTTFIEHTPRWTYPPDTLALDSTKVEAILATVGNSQKLTCDGDLESRRSEQDSARIAWMRNKWLGLGGFEGTANGGVAYAWPGTFILPDNPEALGGDTLYLSDWSPLPQTPCTDTDLDGMPNAFESRYWSDADSATNTRDQDADGWFNIEEYLNGTDPTVFDDPTGAAGGGGDEEAPTYNSSWKVWARRLAGTWRA